MSQRRILTGGAIICPTHKLGLRSYGEISFINSGKNVLWVSTMCAQILGFSRVS